MDFKRRGLLLIVKELRLIHPYFLQAPQTFALRGLLILPRSNVENREALRILSSSESGELIGNKAEFHQSALFKQTVEGPFSFGLQLSKPASGNTLALMVGKLAETAGSLFAAQAIPPLRASIRQSAHFFAGKLAKNDPMLLTQAYAEIKKQSNHTITMTLSASTSISKLSRRKGPKGKMKNNAEPSVKAGEIIAKAKIQLKFFN